jgi:hypothetical protein
MADESRTTEVKDLDSTGEVGAELGGDGVLGGGGATAGDEA